MVQRLPTGYVLDPADPRAPTEEQWAAMTENERAHVVNSLPISLPLELHPPEGDTYRKAKLGPLSALDDFFKRAGRRIYISSELLVLYPGERGFSPDLLAALDVEPHDRERWVVSAEGKGLDLVIEVHVAGNLAKDERENVERYARLGIREYFFFDRAHHRLLGYRLQQGALEGAPRPRSYQRLMPQAGRFTSEVLGLDLVLDGSKLRFYMGNGPLEESEERITHLGAMLDQVIAHKEEADRVAKEAGRLAEELAAKLAEEQKRREEVERMLAEARAEIERLKGR